VKVAEYQHRGAVHFHALIRLDGHDPEQSDAVVPPPAALTASRLQDALRHAAGTTAFLTDPHPARPDGWAIRWGVQLDIRTVTGGGGSLSDEAVAGYLAKYATKATETTGHLSARLTADTIGLHADTRTHVGRLLAACWSLGKPADIRSREDLEAWQTRWGRLRHWAHMLGYGGHFTTKSRRYSTTYKIERARRRTWRRHHPTTGPTPPAADIENQAHGDENTVHLVGTLTYAGIGWRTTGDALLALTAAAQAREQRRTARQETVSSKAA
jgi:hypothetical protein